MALLRNALALLGLTVLAGCGGSSSVSNPAHVRFFNALKSTNSNSSLNTSNVRLVIGGHLFSAGNEGPSYSYGDGLKSYGDAPSATTETITVSPYTASGTTTATATKTLVAGRHYTLVALTSAAATSGVVTTDTQAIILLNDFLLPTTGRAYVRFVEASPTITPVYLRLLDSSGNVVYGGSTTGTTTTGLTAGSFTAYQPVTPTDATSAADYTLQVYSDSAFTNLLSSSTVSLGIGSPKTVVLYDPSSTSTSGFKVKTVTDTTDSQ